MHKNTKILCDSLNVRYVQWRRRSRKNSLSKIEYKIEKRKLLKTQNPSTSKSHYYKKEIIPRKEKTKRQPSLLLGQMVTSLSFSLSLSHCLGSFSLLLDDTKLRLFLLCDTSNQKKERKAISLCAVQQPSRKKDSRVFSLHTLNFSRGAYQQTLYHAAHENQKEFEAFIKNKVG
jgi:hypothetical protein